jgi:hypothetical protein
MHEVAMSDSRAEPAQRIPNPKPMPDGSFVAKARLTPKACTTRASLAIPPSKVMPVIFVPGIMGSNLRTKPTKLNPSEPVWRPPNSTKEAMDEVRLWSSRGPAARQRILRGPVLEVDPTGDVSLPLNYRELGLTPDVARKRGWGEIHKASYAQVLCKLQTMLNSIFKPVYDCYYPESRWIWLEQFDRRRWGCNSEGPATQLTERELKEIAEFHFPVYAFGYNWLQSNGQSALALQARIDSIISEWVTAGLKCSSVVIVTHSMGGLVARACAKQIESKIAGVVHGAMPALGAPACYRRLACGTESTRPGAGVFDDIAMEGFARIAGPTPAHTAPVMGIAPGPLELLPNHDYPSPWLFGASFDEYRSSKFMDHFRLPKGDPYQMYRNTEAWYRLVNPDLLDPAGLLGEMPIEIFKDAISVAERFHRNTLSGNENKPYYHPNTFAFYGDDDKQLSFDKCRWMTDTPSAKLTDYAFLNGKPVSDLPNLAARNVELPDGRIIMVKHSAQDSPGDGTVPARSGSGPLNLVRHTFRMAGFDHQGCYNDEAVLNLTIQLVARVVLSK